MSDSVRPHRQQPTRLPRPWDSPGKNTGVGCHILLQCVKVKSESEVAQSCPTLHNPMDCSPPGSSIHGIFQARVLEWGVIAFSDYQLQSHLYYIYSSTILGVNFLCYHSYSFCLFLHMSWTSEVVLVVKNLLANAGDIEIHVQSLGQENPLHEGLTSHSSILAWRIPWTEEPVRLQPSQT